jgi:hypothetical protein
MKHHTYVEYVQFCAIIEIILLLTSMRAEELIMNTTIEICPLQGKVFRSYDGRAYDAVKQTNIVFGPLYIRTGENGIALITVKNQPAKVILNTNAIIEIYVRSWYKDAKLVALTSDIYLKKGAAGFSVRKERTLDRWEVKSENCITGLLKEGEYKWVGFSDGSVTVAMRSDPITTTRVFPGYCISILTKPGEHYSATSDGTKPGPENRVFDAEQFIEKIN